ncbi:MAG TPA: Hsp20/alpha crystallin family protein, partial [Acidimicrobiales bacterium]
DAYRRGNEFKVHLDLPGADPGSIELTVERDVLTVRATRTSEVAEGDEIQVAVRQAGLGRPVQTSRGATGAGTGLAAGCGRAPAVTRSPDRPTRSWT